MSPPRKPSEPSPPGFAEGPRDETTVGQASFFEGPQTLAQDISPHAGHRDRLRQRFRQTGPEGLPDYELLELLLFRALPRGDTKPLAKRLIARFGSFAEVINAPDQRLKEIDGVGEAVIGEFRLTQACALRLTKGQIIQRPALNSWPTLLDYLRIAQGFEHREQFRILFLDKKNILIADEVQGQGTVDHTPVYVSQV
jgi:DNA repair protein RadC